MLVFAYCYRNSSSGNSTLVRKHSFAEKHHLVLQPHLARNRHVEKAPQARLSIKALQW